MQVEKLNEVDEAGDIIQVYAISPSSDKRQSRVDIVKPSTARKTIFQQTLDVFLPSGFPHSVTDDYVEYQIYVCIVSGISCFANTGQDSLQAFSSSIAGLLSSRAVLSSLGVGDASSSATAAVVLNVLQESLGRLSTIIFAHRFSTAIQPECKMYRLLADVLNDCAVVLDCLSPVLPQFFRILALAIAGVLRSMCGVAASSKTSLSAHFARWGNLAELDAKDSSQETVISLLGMLCGTLVVTMVTGPIATWATLLLLLGSHLELNRRAVRAVAMTTMNRQRAGLVYNQLVQGKVPTPKQISKEEGIFANATALRNAQGQSLGSCRIGISLQAYFATSRPHKASGSTTLSNAALSSLLRPFSEQKYILWYDISTLNERVDVCIALKKGATSRDQLIAWWHATALASAIRKSNTPSRNRDPDQAVLQNNAVGSVLQTSLKAVNDLMQRYEKALEEAGWNLADSKLETSSGVRLVTGDW